MIANSEQWVGQVVDGKFLLERALGGSDRGAVFLAQQTVDRAQRVIRFIRANGGDAGDQLQRWETASKLSHPNLIRVFETGRWRIDGLELFYVSSEYAEEDLAQIIPDRALSADEARQVLQDVLSGLTCIHGQGLVHGDLKPSNIFAVGETVKVSTDSLSPAGQPLFGRPAAPPYDAPEASVATLEPSADVWSLGVVLVEALTQHKPIVDWPREQPALSERIPQPFREIAEHCLHPDPTARWTVAQIADRLGVEKRSQPAVAPPVQGVTRTSSANALEKPQSVKWPYAVAALVAIALFVLLISRSKPAAQPASESTSAASQPVTAAPSSPPTSSPAPQSGDGQVADRLMPRVTPGALHTIQGKIKVLVDLKVDEAGKVTEAHLKSPGSSRYFAEKALQAAKGWKFKPPLENGQPVASEWRVRFTFSRRAVDDSTEQLKP